MINTALSYNIDDYIEILRRRIWYIVVPFVIIIIGTVLYATFAPRLYKASTLVLVTPQKIPESFVQPTVTARIEERLQSISQEVMSRTRLEQVIDEFDLYKEESKKLTREEIVALMQRDIKVELPTRREEKGYFTISYIGKDPHIVTKIANRLSSLFIEENLRFREQQAVGTTEFLSSELTAKQAKLEELETAVTQYKKLHMGELPEQRDTNLRILEQLQNQYQRIGENLRSAQDRKLFIQKQLSDLEMPVASSGTMTLGRDSRSSSSTVLSYSSSGAEVGGTYASQKDSLAKQLDELRSRYTESHPDVIATKKKLADLESKKDTDTYNVKSDPRYKELKNQLMLTDMEIKRLQGEEASIGAQMSRYRGRIENAPSREQEMTSLNREYQNIKDSYNQLLRKSQDAQQAENLERRQKGEQFRVVDPARVPEKPFSPDIPKVLLIGFVLSLGCGLGSAIIREQLDRSFHDVGDVEATLGLRVLATIPKIEEKAA
ncbi:MAG TPA: XrtA system polysaccharide chain length determinant [Syntrophales bacterium]|nr:XrtA system polysaccharide chain length determinant [Syntrophales bacterium]